MPTMEIWLEYASTYSYLTVARVVPIASSPENKEALKAQTPRAIERGIFGSPSFVVGGELFWGDDRLEDAIETAAG